MNYVVIIVSLLLVFLFVSASKRKKKAPEKLSDARLLFDKGEYNAALKALGKAFVIPFSDKITPEYRLHLLGVLDLLRMILDRMNISSNALIDRLYQRLSEATTTIELEESLYKPVADFFEHTASDEELVLFLKQGVISGTVQVAAEEQSTDEQINERTTEIINRAGKFMLKGQAVQAIEVYKEALTQNWDAKDEAFLYDQLGSCYLMNGDLAAAEASYQKSISVKAYFRNVWNYTDFLVYHKRKTDAEHQLHKLSELIRTKSDQKEYNEVMKKWQALS